MYPLWASASLSRCTITAAEFLYPDLSESDEPLRLFVVSLMVEVAVLLKDTRDNIRYAAVNIVVALLQQKRGIMSGLLIKDIQNGDRMDTIDVMNRGGFGALLVAHEVAMSAGGGSSAKTNYASFFEWFDRHQQMVQLVFDDIQAGGPRIIG
jgi:ACT domain-containing protein